MGERMMEWATKPDHLAGVPRRVIVAAVGAFSKVVSSFFNSTTVHNADTLLRLVRHRPAGTPLLTVSNHMLDDPLLWGFKGFPSTDFEACTLVVCSRRHLLQKFHLVISFPHRVLEFLHWDARDMKDREFRRSVLNQNPNVIIEFRSCTHFKRGRCTKKVSR